MPEIEVEIGGRTFAVACRDGEESHLRNAAGMLDTEAAVILGQAGRMPADRMLLLTGLMLADKTATLEDDVDALRGQLADKEQSLRGAEQRLADRARRIAELQEAAPRTELPDRFTDGLAELAARAEAIAEDLDEVAR